MISGPFHGPKSHHSLRQPLGAVEVMREGVRYGMVGALEEGETGHSIETGLASKSPTPGP